ncbi:flagellar protein FlgN [Desulfotomaculum nigrificans]|uniref:flagellar protein FlgN n=1 Tax=Desulfotomaculum nigrificans TaxID=1565 RepID=UPI0001FAE72F|nr:flagellar protein FlgN [Desulfotomaculum nigrificans]
MESLFFELLQVLKALHEKLQEMLRATEQHNIALRHNDITGIKAALQQLDVISRQSKAIDSKREQIQRALEEKLQLSPGATLQETMALAPANIKKGLSDQAMALKETFEQLKNTVQLNKLLTQNAMHFNETILNMLRPAQATYCPSGQSNMAKDTPSLLNKTV